MLKGTVTYISKSGKSAIVAVEKTNGIFKQRMSGFIELAEANSVKVGQSIELPAHTSVEKRKIEDREFDYLTF